MRRGKALSVSLLFFLLGCLSFAQEDLFTTARDGSLEQVSALLTQGFDVNATDEYGQTPLMYAATGNEDPGVITVLVDVGADVDAQTLAGWTALMYAVRDNANPDVADRLLDLGADVDLQNSDQLKALDYADENAAFKGSTAYFQLSVATTTTEAAPEPEPEYTPPPATETRSCCKYCSTGKACGDSCISRSYNCSKGVGCACNASDLDPDSLVYAMLRLMQPLPDEIEVNPVAEVAAPFIDCSFAAAFSDVLLVSTAPKLTQLP